MINSLLKGNASHKKATDTKYTASGSIDIMVGPKKQYFKFSLEQQEKAKTLSPTILLMFGSNHQQNNLITKFKVGQCLKKGLFRRFCLDINN